MCKTCGGYAYSALNLPKIQARNQQNMFFAYLAGNVAFNLVGGIFNLCKSSSNEEVYGGYVAPKTRPEETEETSEEVKAEETPEEALKRIIDGKIDVEEDSPLFKDLVLKYESIKQNHPNMEESLILIRLHNHVKGQEYRAQELQWKQIIADVEEAIKNTDTYKNTPDAQKDEYLKLQTTEILENKNPDLKNKYPELKNKYSELKNKYSELSIGFDGKKVNLIKMATQLVESVDLNADNKASLYEILIEQLAQNYQLEENMTRENALLKARKVVAGYMENPTQIDSLAEDMNNQTIEAKTIREIKTKLGAVEINPDLNLDIAEMSRALYAASEYSTNDDKLDVSDYYRFGEDAVEGNSKVKTSLEVAGAALGIKNFNLEAEFAGYDYKKIDDNNGIITLNGEELPIEYRGDKFILKFGEEILEFEDLQELKVALAELASMSVDEILDM